MFQPFRCNPSQPSNVRTRVIIFANLALLHSVHAWMHICSCSVSRSQVLDCAIMLAVTYSPQTTRQAKPSPKPTTPPPL